MYEIDVYETLTSPYYLARLNDPTPWSKKMMPHHRNMVRSQCRVVASFGGGVARAMATLRFSPATGDDEHVLRDLRDILAGLTDRPGITGSHALRTETPAIAATTEQRIRGGDAVADWVALVSGYDPAALDATASEIRCAISHLTVADAPPILASQYRLSYSLSCEDAAQSCVPPE